MPTVGSAYSGIGGLDRAMEELGFAVRWQIENEEYPAKILARHWPEVRRYGDIRRIDPESLERVDAICAGFPCQPWSVAGKQRGESDDRNLWPETIRLIRGVRPRYVFLENVPGLVAHGYFGTVLGDLAAGGYDAEWGCYTAAQVGASHRRDRLLILAYARHAGRPGRIGSTESGEGEPCCQPSPQGRDVGHPEGQLGEGRAESAGRERSAVPGRPGSSVADAALQRQREQDNPQCSESRGISRGDSSGDSGPMADTGNGQFPNTGRRSEGRVGLEYPRMFPPGPGDLTAWARVLSEVPEARPAVCKLVDGLPDRVAALRALGNAVVKAQAVHAFRELWARMEES
ncbi:hypothetical protein CMI37_20270 [Candidatus Pacearchaeota archaeon]|nr:hypothetical protein [Candidatus Pacearchaeota archaeon]